jgi:arsenite-transporting ATPase
MTSALAHAAARRGRRVLIAEVGDNEEDYSPLARYFGREQLPIQPEPMVQGIAGVVLLARTGQELFLKDVLRSSTLSRAALGSEAIRRLLAAAPSFREMGIFYHLLSLLRAKRADASPEHDLVIVDMPATGHTLSLTGLPELLLRLIPTGPIAMALREGQAFFNDPEKSAAWVVTLPETLPVSECLELLEGLGKSRMPIGGVLLNRVPVDPYRPEERAALEPILREHDVLGKNSFRRPLRARREVERLLASTDVPVYALPEVDSTELIVAMTEAIAQAQALPRAGAHEARP